MKFRARIEENYINTIWDLIRNFSSLPKSLLIKGKNDVSIEFFKKYSRLFLFNYCLFLFLFNYI